MLRARKHLMNQTINYFLSRHPSLYRLALKVTNSPNTEKMAFLHLIKNGDVVLDVGANQGGFTVLFSHLVGGEGMTHSFEPVPPTFSALSHRVKKECRFQNVSLNNCALGDTKGTFQITVPSGDFAQASLKNHVTASWSKPNRSTFDCSVCLIDDYVAEKKMDRLDFIKIDVEGAELPALRGGQQTIERFHPVIHLEYFAPWTEAFGYTAADLVSFLQARGYTHFYLDNLSTLQSPLTHLEEASGSQNVICSTKSIGR